MTCFFKVTLNQYASRHPEGHRQAGEEGQTDIGWIMNFLLIQSIKKNKIQLFGMFMEAFKRDFPSVS